MSLAQYADPIVAIKESMALGRRGEVMRETPDGDTLDRIASLLRSGLVQGICPRWTLRLELGVKVDKTQCAEIADQVEDGFTSGEYPVAWRLAVYNN